MKSVLRKISLVFAAGCVGGLANSLVVWLSGARGLTRIIGVDIAPQFTLAWLYPRLVWGGIWGLVFLIPIFSKSHIKKGLLLSLAPTAVQLFVIFPHQTSYGNMGLALGTLTPLAVLIFNAVWGVAAALWLWGTKSGR